MVLSGTLKLTTQQLACALSTDLLQRALLVGGRVLIRIHCGTLQDTQKKVFSAATDALSPPPPCVCRAGFWRAGSSAREV